MSEKLLYFAYGSNLWWPRMRERIPSSRFVTSCWLPNFELVFRKPGVDGSAKADIRFTGLARHVVYGVLYRISAREQAQLDAIEGGYHQASVITQRGDDTLRAFTYIASQPLEAPFAPFEWYLELIAAGARAHELPDSYLSFLEQVVAVPDPDPSRHARNRPQTPFQNLARPRTRGV